MPNVQIGDYINYHHRVIFLVTNVDEKHYSVISCCPQRRPYRVEFSLPYLTVYPTYRLDQKVLTIRGLLVRIHTITYDLISERLRYNAMPASHYVSPWCST